MCPPNLKSLKPLKSLYGTSLYADTRTLVARILLERFIKMLTAGWRESFTLWPTQMANATCASNSTHRKLTHPKVEARVRRL